MATYHALVSSDGVYCTVRSADNGVTNDEFQAGVRVSPRGYRSSKMVLLNEMFSSNEITNDLFIYKEKADKWDKVRMIY